MEKLDNQKLKDAIKKMKEENTPENISDMLTEMMKSKFMNPTTLNILPDKNGNINIPNGTQISFYTISSTDKKKFAIAFTDQEEFDKWYDINVKNGTFSTDVPKNSALMEFLDYAEIVLNQKSDLDGFVINPYNENVVFNREQIASLRTQRINKDNKEKYGITKNIIQKDDKIVLRKLEEDEFPTDLVQALINYMKNVPNIKLAAILKMKKAEEEERNLLVVDFEGELNQVLGNIAKVAKPFLGPLGSLELVSLNSPLGKEAMKNAETIYNKNGLQLFTRVENIEQSDIVKNAIIFVKDIFKDNKDGHDEYHTLRVFSLADKIAQEEGADIEIVRLAALLHDVDDRKLFGDEHEPFENANKFLTMNNVNKEDIEKIKDIVLNISFKGSGTKIPESLEGKIVQDADRLDGIGAIGIARTFAYTAIHGNKIHNPEVKYREEFSVEEYYSETPTAINHFYEKLLKLKDLMNTETGKRVAESRHKFMEKYLKEFYDEWDGIK